MIQKAAETAQLGAKPALRANKGTELCKDLVLNIRNCTAIIESTRENTINTIHAGVFKVEERK